MSELHPLWQVLAMAAVTAALRFAPFVLDRGSRKQGGFLSWLGTALPPAVMAMLVVYCLRGTDFLGPDHGVPTVLACGVTVALHMRKRSTLLSILGGTGCYMLLVQLVF